MVFDGTITLNTLLTALAIFGGYIAVGIRVSSKMTAHDLRISSLEKANETIAETMKQVTNILTVLARQDERLIMLQREVDELRHGRGFVVERSGP